VFAICQTTLLKYGDGSHPASVNVVLTDLTNGQTVTYPSAGCTGCDYDPDSGYFALNLANFPSDSCASSGDNLYTTVDDGGSNAGYAEGQVSTGAFTMLGTITLTPVTTTTIPETTTTVPETTTTVPETTTTVPETTTTVPETTTSVPETTTTIPAVPEFPSNTIPLGVLIAAQVLAYAIAVRKQNN